MSLQNMTGLGHQKETGNYQLIEDQATAWYTRLHHGEDSESHKKVFAAWLEADARHQVAYKEVSAFMQSTECFTDDPVLEQVFSETLADSGQRHNSHPTYRWLIAVAATLLITIGGYSVYLTQLPVNIEETARGEQKKLVLEDGTRMKLNTDTRVRISYDEDLRKIHLQHGQAYFRVAKDLNRPFRVVFEDGYVEALGTEFDVYKRPEGVAVTLLEGRVAVRHEPELLFPAKEAGFSNEVILETEANVKISPQVLVTHSGLSALQKPERLSVEAWQSDQLVFTDAPIDKVLAEISRYSPNQVYIGDNSLRDIRITGVFTTDRDRTLAILEKYYDVKTSVKLNGDLLLIPN